MGRDELRLHQVLPRIEPSVSFFDCSDRFALERAAQVVEVWQLGPTGRHDGEPLGWMGIFKQGIAWKMAPGVGGRYAKGFHVWLKDGVGPPVTIEFSGMAPEVIESHATTIDHTRNNVVNIMKLAILGDKADERRAGEVLGGARG